MEFEKEVLKGYIDTMILSVLIEKDMYGYEISKRIKEKSNNEFEMKEATLYVSLKRLEKKNYIEGYWNDDENTGGGRRRYYRIIEDGKRVFNEKIREWNALQRVMNCFMEGKGYEEN